MEKKILVVLEKHQRDLQAEQKIVSTSQGAILLEALVKAKVEISHTCGGFGTCGTCRVEVMSSSCRLHDRNEIEAEMAADRGFREDERLACQLKLEGNVHILIPDSEVQSTKKGLV